MKTPINAVTPTYVLHYTRTFDAAHHLRDYDGKCARPHGHTYRVKVDITTQYLRDDMVIDYEVLKKILDQFDHQDINALVAFQPTCENIARSLALQIADQFKRGTATVMLTLWETPNGSCTVTI